MVKTVDPLDAASIATLRGLLAQLDPEGDPVIVPLQPMRRASSVRLIPGSFNPPTLAHGALADRAMSDGYDAVLFCYAVRTSGKPASGLSPEDRILAMRLAAPDGVGVVLSSHGLLVDQAEAAARAFPDAQLSFLVGSDKLEQLFEARWYTDRDEALERLFERAIVAVAPRHGQAERVRFLLERPDVRPFAHRIELCHLHPSVGEVSSTRVRRALRAGADPGGLVPTGVERFLIETGAFAPPIGIGLQELDRYELRQRLLDLVVDGRCTREAPDLHGLWRLTLDPGEQGRRMRALLDA